MVQSSPSQHSNISKPGLFFSMHVHHASLFRVLSDSLEPLHLYEKMVDFLSKDPPNLPQNFSLFCRIFVSIFGALLTHFFFDRGPP